MAHFLKNVYEEEGALADHLNVVEVSLDEAAEVAEQVVVSSGKQAGNRVEALEGREHLGVRAVERVVSGHNVQLSIFVELLVEVCEEVAVVIRCHSERFYKRRSFIRYITGEAAKPGNREILHGDENAVVS